MFVVITVSHIIFFFFFFFGRDKWIKLNFCQDWIKFKLVLDWDKTLISTQDCAIKYKYEVIWHPIQDWYKIIVPDQDCAIKFNFDGGIRIKLG